MERRFESRREEVLADCQVPPAVFNGMMERLVNVRRTVCGAAVTAGTTGTRPKLSARIAVGLGAEERGSDRLSPRRGSAGVAELHRHFALGSPAAAGGVGVPSRPGTGRAGRRDGFRSVGVPQERETFGGRGAAVVRSAGQTGELSGGRVSGLRLAEGTRLGGCAVVLAGGVDEGSATLQGGGVPPKEMRFRTRHELALEMLETKGPLLPHAWIAGDDEMGRPAWFRRELAARGERYLLAVPSNTTIRDLEADPPPYSGRGQPPKQPFRQVRKWCESLPANAWTRVEVRDGTKGPIEVEIVKRRVVAKIDRKVGAEEMLVVIRSLDEEKKVKTDYYLSNAPPDTSLAEFARVANAEHRIEECIKRGKSEAGMAAVPGAELAWVASSYHALPDGDLVLVVRGAAGEKNGRRRSRFRKSVNGLRRSCAVPAAATRPRVSDANASAGLNATNSPSLTITTPIIRYNTESSIHANSRDSRNRRKQGKDRQENKNTLTARTQRSRRKTER